MQIIIATDGDLNPEATAELAGRLYEEGDVVTVVTVIEVPRTLLTELPVVLSNAAPQVHIDEDHEYVGQPTGGTLSPQWPGDDAMIARYVADQKTKRTNPMKGALESKGIQPVVVADESDSPSSALLRLVEDSKPISSSSAPTAGAGFEGLLSSTGTKLARLRSLLGDIEA